MRSCSFDNRNIVDDIDWKSNEILLCWNEKYDTWYRKYMAIFYKLISLTTAAKLVRIIELMNQVTGGWNNEPV